MLQSRHRRIRSTQRATTSNSPVATTHARSPSLPIDAGVVEWSKTTTRACSRLIPSLHQIFNRGDSFNGVAGDSYGLLLSNDSAFIFPYASTSSTPPILTFPLPQGEDKLLGALVPGPSNEPGLVVIMPISGRIGFWPALHSALAPSSGLESKLSLSHGEYVTHLCNAGAAGLVLSTSSGKLVHVSLRDAAGKAVVVITNMSGNGGWLGAIINVATRKEIVSIKAGAARSREEREIHVVTKRGGLTIWEIARGGNYRSILDHDLHPLLQEESVSEVLDVVAYPVETNSVLLLSKTNAGLIKVLGIRFDGQAQPEITHRFTLPALDNPKILLPNPGHIAFVHTRDSVYLISVADKSLELIKFKQAVDIVAVGVEDQLKNKRNPGLVLLTDGAGVLRIESFGTSTTTLDSIKSKLEQAVFYGSKEDNPLSFLPAPTGSDVQARELSEEILDGSSPFLRRSVNLADTLSARVQALDALTDYILNDVKPTTLQVLRQNAEKLIAGEALWASVDARVEGSSIISQLVPASAETQAKKAGGDKVRWFFMHGLGQIAEVIHGAHRACIEAAAVLDSQPLSSVVLETNEIILAVLMSATKYREDNPKYGSQGDKWTSSAEILQSTTVQFDISRRLIAGLREGEGDDLREQLVGLASLNCRLYEDALASSPVNTSEHKHIAKKYNNLRPKWLRSLVEIGRTARSFEVGEKYKDFQSLIEICHDQGEKANDEEIIGTVVRRLEWYLHSFGYDFASVLWEYYISHRQFWNLLHEFPNYREHLTAFFQDGRYPNISWMNDVILGDFDRAGKTLLSIPETRVEKRKIQLSIARLALLVTHDSVPKEVEDQIQVSLIMDSLLSDVKAASKDAIDSTAALELACASFIASDYQNKDRPELLRRHLAKLTRSEILALGEAIDYLTSKVEPDFFTALYLLRSSTALDSVRSFFEQLIWRRCFTSDNWITIVDTEGKSDLSVEADTAQTHLFQTIRKCLQHTEISVRLLSPKEAYYKDSQVVPLPGLTAEELANLKNEYILENETLDRYEALADLPSWWSGIVRAAEESLRIDPDDDFVKVEHNHANDDDVFMTE